MTTWIIYVGIKNKVRLISLGGVVESDDTESNQNKMHVNGNETETPETTASLKSKLRDHANRTGFKTSPTWSNCRRAAKVANAY